MKQDLIYHLSHTIYTRSKGLSYTVKDEAPSTFQDLYTSTGLVVWSGESNNTVFHDPMVNYMFRALHDKLHLETLIGFTPLEEMDIGRIQANQFEGIIADIVYCEVAGQAEYYLNNGAFVENQVEFTENYLNN